MMQIEVGAVIGRYQIREELGRGGMAVVYKAFDTVLQRFVAIKIILPSQQSDRFLKRFDREAKTLAQLSHPSILKILDNNTYQNLPYLVMEFVAGGSLSSRMGRPYPYAEAAAIIAPIARALQHAHDHRVIHRDVKPGNILINESGQPMLSDFGIVKLLETDESQSLTSTGSIVGTPAYMSPEQASGGTIDGRSDIYSLGVIFYELVTGRKPFTANTPVELTLKHLKEPVPRPKQIVRDLPQEAEQIILKSLAKNPDDRFQNMAAFASALEKLAGAQKSAGLVGPSIEPQEAKTSSAPKFLIPLAVLGLLLVAIAVTVMAAPGLFFGTPPTMTPIAQAVATVTNTPTLEPSHTPEPTATATLIPPTQTTEPSPTFTITASPTEEIIPSATPTLKNERVVSVNNLDTLIELGWLDKVSVVYLDWTANGKWIVAGGSVITLIDPITMRSSATINWGNDLLSSMTVSADSTVIYMLGGNRVRAFDIETRKEKLAFDVLGGSNSIALSPDGKTIAVGMRDSKVILADSQNGGVLRTLRSNYGGWSVAFSPDGNYVAAGTSQGALIWEVSTGIWLPLESGQEYLIKAMLYSPDGTLLAGASENIIFLWDAKTGAETMRLEGNFGNANALDFSPDGTLLVAACDDKLVHLWDLTTKTDIRQLKGHLSPVSGVSFSPDGVFISTGANEGFIRKWGVP